MARAPALGAGCGRRSGPLTSRASRAPEKDDDEEGWVEKPPLALAAAPTYSLPPARRRKGEDEEEEEKERAGGWGGRTGYKDRLGGMVEDFWSPQQRLFLTGGGGGSQRRRGSPSYDCRMLIAPAWVRGLLPETEPDSEVVQLCSGRDI